MTAIILPVEEPGDHAGEYLAQIPTANTRRARASDLADMQRRFPEALDLIASGPRELNRIAAQWRDQMTAERLHPRTINRKLGTLRDFVRFLRAGDVIGHGVDVKGAPKGKRPMRQGPGEAAVADIWRVLGERDDPAAPRDRALFALLYVHALRISEALGLDVGDVNLGVPEIMIRRKGRKAWKEAIPLEPGVAGLLEAWLSDHPWRFEDAAPVFLGRDQGHEWRRTRLTAGRARVMCRGWGRNAGVEAPVRPHGLRHTHATVVLDRAGAEVARCSLGHGSLATLSQYDDGETRRALEGAGLAAKVIMEGGT